MTKLLILIGILFVCSCTAHSDGNRQDNNALHSEQNPNENNEQPVQEKELTTLWYDHIISDSTINLMTKQEAIEIKAVKLYCGMGMGHLCSYLGFDVSIGGKLVFEREEMERAYLFHEDTHEWPKLLKLPSGEYLLLGERYLGEPEGSVIDGYKFTKEALVNSSFAIGDDLTPLESLIKKME